MENAQQQINDFLSRSFKWTIENFSELNAKKLYSNIFSAGGYRWRVGIFPKGNDVGHLPVYLEVADSAALPTGWSKYAKFSVAVISQLNNKFNVTKEARYEFNVTKTYSGFKRFIPLGELYDPERGYIVNDTCIVEADVAVPRVLDWTDGSKTEARLCTTIQIACDEDLLDQIGKDLHFDLVDYDKVRSFIVPKGMRFDLFKAKVATEFGIPVGRQRFWRWGKRLNHTSRPNYLLLTKTGFQSFSQDEGKRVFEPLLANNAYLQFFLEVERGQDIQEHSFSYYSPGNGILLFFKLYDPFKEELRYAGRLIVECSCTPMKILEKLNAMAGYPDDEEIELYEEIRFEPYVMCEHLDEKMTFHDCQLRDGDIICFQKLLPFEDAEKCRYPNLPLFLDYVNNRQFVRFRSLEKPEEDEFCLELSKNLNHDDVAERVASHLGLKDPSKIRFTSCQPIKYRGVVHLTDMLVHCKQNSDILYYEVAETPFRELQGLETSEVVLHHDAKEEFCTIVRTPMKEDSNALLTLPFLKGNSLSAAHVKIVEEIFQKHGNVLQQVQVLDPTFKAFFLERLASIVELFRSYTATSITAEVLGKLKHLIQSLACLGVKVDWMESYYQKVVSSNKYVQRQLHIEHLKEQVSTAEIALQGLKDQLVEAEKEITVVHMETGNETVDATTILNPL